MKIERSLGNNAAPDRPRGAAPSVDNKQVTAACAHSAQGRGVRDRLEASARDGHCMSRGEVKDLMQQARGPDGKLDKGAAVVLAKYRQEHPEMFDGDAMSELDD